MSTSRYSKSNWTPTTSALATWTFDATAESFTVSGTGAAMTRQTGVVRTGAGAGQWVSGSTASGRAYKTVTRGDIGRRAYVTYYDYRQAGAGSIGAVCVFTASPSSGYTGYSPTAAWTQRTPGRKWHPTATVVGINYGGQSGNGAYIDDVQVIEEDYDGWLLSSPDSPAGTGGFDAATPSASYYEMGQSSSSDTPNDVTLTRTITGLTSGRDYRFRVDARASSATYPANVTIGATGVGNTTVAITATSQTFINYDFTATGSSHVFTIRAVGTNVRAGIRIYSVNLLEYNVPNGPTLTTRTNFSPGTSAQFAWTFSDPDAGDTQSAYEIDIATDSGFSNIVYNGSKVSSSTQNMTLAAGTLSPSTLYYWRVRNWDQDDYVGAWSSTGSFSTTAGTTAPTLTTRTAFTPNVTAAFAWTFADPDAGASQTAYEIEIATDSGFTSIVVDSGKVVSGTASYTLAANALAASTLYYWRVRTWDNYDYASAFSSTGSFTTNNVPPTSVLTTRTKFNPANSATFAWSFSDYSPGTQASWLLRIYSDSALSNLVHSASAANTNTSTSVAGGTLAYGTDYWWTVQVTDNIGAINTVVKGQFTTASIPNVPTLTTRTDFDAEDAATFAWTFNDGDVFGETLLDDQWNGPSNVLGWATDAANSAVFDGVYDFWENAASGSTLHATKTLAGLTPGAQYGIVAYASGYETGANVSVGVTGIGSSTPVSAPLYPAYGVRMEYVFTATGTSHTIQITGQNPGKATDITLFKVAVSRIAAQSARQVVIKQGGSPVFDTGKVSSASLSYNLTASTLDPATAYTWEVTTWDFFDLQSPTGSGSFETHTPGTVTIDFPAPDGVEIDTDDFDVEWTFTPGEGGATQTKYRVIVTSVGGTHLDTGWVTSSNTTQAVTGLDTDVLYEVTVQVEDSLTVLTEPAVSHVLPNYNEPMVPTAVLTAYGAYVEIVVTNPTPTGDKPEADFNRIFRSRSGADSFAQVGFTSVNGTFRDYFIAAGVNYDYYIRAVTN